MGCAESAPVESPAEVDRSAELLLEWRGSTLGADQPVRFAPSSMTKWKIALVKATVDESHLQCSIGTAQVGYSPGAYGGGQAVNLCTVWCVPEVGAKSSSALALKPDPQQLYPLELRARSRAARSASRRKKTRRGLSLLVGLADRTPPVRTMLSGIRRLSKSGSKKDATDGGERLTFSITRADGTFGVGLSDSNYITSIEEGTPAASTGLMPGDLIVAVNGEDLDGRKVTNVMAKSPDLDTIKLTVERRPPPTQRKGSLTDRMPKLSLSGRASGAEVISESSDPDIQRTLSTMMPGETMVSIRLTRAQARAQFGAQFGAQFSAQFGLRDPVLRAIPLLGAVLADAAPPPPARDRRARRSASRCRIRTTKSSASTWDRRPNARGCSTAT